jgi:hypothetical protein
MGRERADAARELRITTGMRWCEIAARLAYANGISALSSAYGGRCTPEQHDAMVRRRKGPRHTAGGYLRAWEHDHPLATKSGLLLHRQVLYDELGPGPHPCHWCKRPLDWPEIAVDHLNGVRDDNRPENLVPSCSSPCNAHREAEWAKARQGPRCECPEPKPVHGVCESCWGEAA